MDQPELLRGSRIARRPGVDAKDSQEAAAAPEPPGEFETKAPEKTEAFQIAGSPALVTRRPFFPRKDFGGSTKPGRRRAGTPEAAGWRRGISVVRDSPVEKLSFARRNGARSFFRKPRGPPEKPGLPACSSVRGFGLSDALYFFPEKLAPAVESGRNIRAICASVSSTPYSSR